MSVNALFNPPSQLRGSDRNYRHGHKPAAGKPSGEYLAWCMMRARCCNPTNPSYKRYGARGIGVCARWQTDFPVFLEDMGRRPGPGYSIERINNDGDYEPDNCRWATAKEQANNRRSNRVVEYDGRRLTLEQWAEAAGIQMTTLHARLKKGWPMSTALSPRDFRRQEDYRVQRHK